MIIQLLAPNEWYVVAGGDIVAGPYTTSGQAQRAYPKARLQ